MWGRGKNIEELNPEGEDAREYSPGEKYHPGQKNTHREEHEEQMAAEDCGEDQ